MMVVAISNLTEAKSWVATITKKANKILVEKIVIFKITIKIMIQSIKLLVIFVTSKLALPLRR
jgi:hypothetical protein